MTVWPVFVEEWQMACCGDAFAVGDQVAWTLTLSSEDDGRVSEAHVTLQDPDVVLVVDDLRVLRVGGLTAAWRGATRGRRASAATGLLVEDRHGDTPSLMPMTHGVVQRIQLVRQRHRLQDVRWPWGASGRCWVATPGPVGLRPIEHTPQRFDLTRHGHGDVSEWESGLLVDLAVDDAQSQHPATTTEAAVPAPGGGRAKRQR